MSLSLKSPFPISPALSVVKKREINLYKGHSGGKEWWRKCKAVIAYKKGRLCVIRKGRKGKEENTEKHRSREIEKEIKKSRES